jgi:hypothetical protein
MKTHELIDRIDLLVFNLEEEGIEFDLILDAIREYVSIIDDINGNTAGL